MSNTITITEEIDVDVDLDDYIDEIDDDTIKEEFERRGLEIDIQEYSSEELIDQLCAKLDIIKSGEFYDIATKYFKK